MNKIEVDNLIIDKENILIDLIDKNTNIYLKGKSSCKILKLITNIIINIYLESNSNSLIELVGVLDNNTNKIFIHNEFNTKLDFNIATTFTNKNDLEINSVINNSHVLNNIKVRLVENNGSIKVLATGDILENISDVEYLEDIKAIVTNNENITIIPNLLVKSNEIIANHNTTISNINYKDLFYLKSKGLSEDLAINLIKKGFLESIIRK